jgi:hypothetical protein
MALRHWALVLLVSLGYAGCAAQYRPSGVAEDATQPVLREPTDYDPFAGELPALILDAQLQQQAGNLLDIGIQRQLFDFGRAKTEDPRPWILLARDSMERDWVGFAMSQYGLALRADARVTRAHDVLSDVLQTAVNYTSVEESDANALLQEYWGLDALPAIERELALMQEQGRDAAATKLMAIREALIASAQ